MGVLGWGLLAPFLPFILLVESVVLVWEAWWCWKGERDGTLGEGDGFWSGRLGGLFAQEWAACLAGAVIAAIEGLAFGVVESLAGVLLLFFLYLGSLVVMKGAIVLFDQSAARFVRDKTVRAHVDRKYDGV